MNAHQRRIANRRSKRIKWGRKLAKVKTFYRVSNLSDVRETGEYVAQIENVKVENGNLVVEARVIDEKVP